MGRPGAAGLARPGLIAVQRRLTASALALTILGGGGATTLASGALLSDQDASAVGIAADVLAPPTSLAAIGGPSAGLTWIPSVDAATTGYEIWRAAASGGPYGLVSTVTPGSASAATDAPTAGAWYYVLRSVLQNWRSIDSNEASATIVLGSVGTGFLPCSAATSAADSGGDGNGYETSTANACADDGLLATDAGTGVTGRSTSCANPANDRHRFLDFAIGLPPSVTSIDGIEVRAEVGLNNNGGTSTLCAELSWDGGTTWTAPRSVTLAAAASTVYAFGGPADTWGRSWTVGELSDASFRIRLTDATSQPNKDYRLDVLTAQVTYSP
jgi:hypothetical protein